MSVDLEERQKKEKIADIAEKELLSVNLTSETPIDTAPQKSPPPGPWTEPEVVEVVAKPTFTAVKSKTRDELPS